MSKKIEPHSKRWLGFDEDLHSIGGTIVKKICPNPITQLNGFGKTFERRHFRSRHLARQRPSHNAFGSPPRRRSKTRQDTSLTLRVGREGGTIRLDSRIELTANRATSKRTRRTAIKRGFIAARHLGAKKFLMSQRFYSKGCRIDGEAA